jgi:shikimate dehydrogenase
VSPSRRPWAAVLGSPIGHSLSPALHRAAYAELGFDWDYTAIECDEAALPDLLAEVSQDITWRGLSLTMPLKLAAVPLVDRLAPRSAAVGAVNTVLPAPDGLVGDNTDLPGVVAALAELGVPHPVAPVLLGAGGTARAVIGALAELAVPGAVAVLRDPARGTALVDLAARLGVELVVTGWDTAPDRVARADVVVSTTPAGSTDTLAETGWPAGVPLVDVLYEPWPTRLALAAQAAGARVVGGLPLLVHQAAAQVELMTGSAAPMEAMRTAGERALAARAGVDHH